LFENCGFILKTASAAVLAPFHFCAGGLVGWNGEGGGVAQGGMIIANFHGVKITEPGPDGLCGLLFFGCRQ
jgi:hypothetical protein